MREEPSWSPTSVLDNISKLASETKPPIIRQINALAHKNAIRLWLWELPFSVAPEIKEVFRNLRDEDYRYWPNAWLTPLREAVSKKYNPNWTTENSLITIWVQEAVEVSLSALRKAWAKKVMIPEINFWIYKKNPTELWFSVLTFKLNEDFSIDLEAFEKQVASERPDVIIINSPGNPTWYIYSEEEMLAISKILSKYWNPFVISDDIYSELAYWREFTPIYDKYKNTIVVDWISKSWAAAWLRVWWIYCENKEFITVCVWESTRMISNPPTPTQLAALPVVKWETQETIDWYKNILSSNSQIVRKSLQDLWIEVSDSMGWFYSFPNVSNYTWNDTEDFCKFAASREDWVVVIPWKAFWRPTNIRISFATSEENIVEWMKRLSILLKEYKKEKGIENTVKDTSWEVWKII